MATGVAERVVAYRAFNERSGMRFGQVQMRLVENADSTGWTKRSPIRTGCLCRPRRS